MAVQRLLLWSSFPGGIHTTYSSKAAGFVYQKDDSFHWEVVGGSKRWLGTADSLHSAKAHVEGNFVARGLMYDQTPQSETLDG